MLSKDCTMLTLPGKIVKNKDAITLPLSSELTAIVKKQFRKDSEPLCEDSNLRKEWGAATQAAKVPDLLIHDLRRSGVRNLTLAGVPETVAMKISGHLTASVFRRYAIAAPAKIKNAMAAVDQRWHFLEIDVSSMSVGVFGVAGF